MIRTSVLECIGNTPLVRLHKIPQKMGIECDILVKCEFFNAGGSIKDRIALNMVEKAELDGTLKPGDTIIEPTSGNTGIGLALAAAIKGYRCIITLPEKMSSEKVDVLKALGAEIIRTPTEAASDSPDSHIGIAKRLQLEIPNSVILDQYKNEENPNAHYNGTAEELLDQCDGKIDMLVAGVGTGGTITGVGKRLKENCPGIQIVGVDPVGSILAMPSSLNKVHDTYQVEGIGYDFIPDVLDRNIVSKWVKTNDKESFIMARRLIREEGLLCGGSSGSAMVAAVKEAGKLKKGQTCVVILPDSTRNYMTKFLSDQWMHERNYVEHHTHSRQNYKKFRKSVKLWWSDKTVRDLKLHKPSTILPNVTCAVAVDMMKKMGYDQLPVVDELGHISGVVTLGNLLAKIASERIQLTDNIQQFMYRSFQTVYEHTILSDLANIFDTDYFAIVMQSGPDSNAVAGIATRIDFLNYITGTIQ